MVALLARSLSSGSWPAFWLGVGEVLGDSVYLLFVVISLGAAADAITPYMIYVRYVGGAYLAYVGVKQFNAAPMRRAQRSKLRKRDVVKSLFEGFLISGSNPKVVVFYLTLLPLFVDIPSLNIVTGAQTVLTIMASLLIAVIILVLSGQQLSKLLDRPNFALWLNRVTGMMMIGVGIWIALA